MPQFRMRSGSRKAVASKMKAPPHPFPELQGPFEESMTELERLDHNEVPSDAASRRTILLDAPTYERVIAGRWKQRPGEKYHPLWKIVAQLSFGIHLLAESLAKSEEEVMQILQGHIDEIDLFLERTTEDFALAQDDIQERMRCLQLPLQHPKVFERMLEDRTFRNSIVEGNEKIEHIVARTACAMKDSLKDAQKGLDATGALEQYLGSVEQSWGRRNADHEAVFEAMLENVEGWRTAFIELHSQGRKLGTLLKDLTDVINQMQQRAGEVSRKLIRAQRKQGVSPTDSSGVTYVSRQSATSTIASRSGTPDAPPAPPRKPLPGVPSRQSGRQSSNPSLRCETAQSNRSVNSHRSSHAQKSRTSSRDGGFSSARNSAQARSSAKSPRIVEISRKAVPIREVSQTAPIVQNEIARPAKTISLPAELPGELPQASSVISGRSDASCRNAGLGIIGGETDDKHNSAHGSSGMASVSRLPLTPSSIDSNIEVNRTVAYELPSGNTDRSASAPAKSSTNTALETALGSPPGTPGWARQTFDMQERDRMITDKTAFRSHPPHAELGSPPVMFPGRFHTQPQHTRVEGSIGSSLGAPGPEVTLMDRALSVRSGSVRTTSTTGLSVETVATAPPATHATGSAMTAKSKTFIAELEGTTPLTLRSASYNREATREMPREVTQEVIELEAPQQLLETTSRPGGSGLVADDATLERKVAAAIRKSFIATNIELADTSVGDILIKVVGSMEEQPDKGVLSNSASELDAATEDILAQLNQLNATSPNLSLKGEEMLMTLPATTYVAMHQPSSRPPTAPTAQTLATVVESPKSPEGAWSKSPTMRSKAERSARNSTESSASSQSQWRAFFKGQLSPSEFSASTPHLPSTVSSTHKAIVELQRRGQEASPTLGWQWAPESPEIERKTMQRARS